MRIINSDEQAQVAGCGDYAVKLQTFGNTVGQIVISPIAMVLSTFAADSPQSSSELINQTFSVITRFGGFVGGNLGKVVGLTADFLLSQ